MYLPPFQNEPLADFPVNFVGPREANIAISSARRVSGDWARTPVENRAAILLRAAETIRKRRFELAAAILLEVGKNRAEADADVCEAIDFLEYYAREMLRLVGAVHEPPLALGVVAVIAPWNFPLAILTGMTAAALVTGNAVLMKPAEQSSLIAQRAFEILRDAGIPEGVLHFLPGIGETVGDFLVRSPEVDLVCFTGSKEVGMRIANIRASRGRSPSVASGKIVEQQMGGAGWREGSHPATITEMGGKNAIIIDESADLDASAEAAVLSAFGYQGQKCSACSRVILLPEIETAFKKRFLERVSQIRVGDPRDPENFMGPVIDDEAAAKIRRYIELGKKEGRLLYKGNAPGEGRYLPPTVFEDVSPNSRIAQEEIFGPVVCLIKATGLSEALKIANGVPYDLTGGLFSRDAKTIERIRREFQVGNLYINRKITGALVACQPFGGYRLSSLGFKAGGPEYLYQFLKEPRLKDPPPHRDLPSAPFQANDRNELIYIKEGKRLLGKTICTRLA